MNYIAIFSDVIAGLLSAIIFSLLTYFYGFKHILRKIDKLNEKTELYKLSTLDIVNEAYNEKIKEIRYRLDSLNREIKDLVEKNHQLKSEEEYWFFQSTLNEKETKREETYNELDYTLEKLLSFYNQFNQSESRNSNMSSPTLKKA